MTVKFIRILLYPVSLLYALVVHIRNYLFDIGILATEAFKVPTICIGNLSFGGTGKTPMAELLIELLRERHKVALLSRGYRRKSEGYVLADERSSVTELGDEPYQIFSKFGDVAVAVDADRRNGIRMLERDVSPDLILLDDAFQHRRVECGLNILLTAYDNLYVDDYYLPTGNLRDAKYGAKRADLIIVTKCPSALSAKDRFQIVQHISPKEHQQVLFSCLEYDKRWKGDSGELPLDYFSGKALTLVTGIAKPSPLVDYLEGIGLSFEHLRFNDHHSFTDTEVDILRKKENVVTTEKDYVRLQNSVEPLYYLAVRHRFLGDGLEILEERLQKYLGARWR